MAELKLQTSSLEKYFQLEDSSEIKHEYINGQIVAMAGSSLKHNEISLNVAATLRAGLRAKGKPCKTYISDARLQIGQGTSYYYPDVIVTCEATDWENNRNIQFPTLIVEVLSESTQSIDLTTKLFNYLQIPSLQYYLVIAQTETQILCYERADQGWILHLYDDISQLVSLSILDINMTISDIYATIEQA